MTIAGFFAPESCPAWTVALINHLWQSTAVVLIAWLLTMLLRANSARVRYKIWMIASIKFLVPFAFISSLGALWARPNPSPQVGPSLYVFVEEIGQPFHPARILDSGAAAVALSGHSSPLVSILFAAVWLFGFLVMQTMWIGRWRRAAGMARSAEPIMSDREFDALRLAERGVGIKKPIPLILSSSEVVPGVFGLIRPVLLWPVGLSERLEDAQIEAIMSHEVEHVCRHDNLSAAIHALIEAIFWFHPLVRWISTRLNEERERACDERVIERNARPETYAESILKVCAFCLEPPTPCISGVSGADLKDRILRIMTRHSGVALSSAKKTGLSVVAVMILAAPLGFGVLRGQAPSDSLATSQSAVATLVPKYEVATIKPNTANDNKLMIMMRPDGISLKAVEVQMLLQQAFGLEPDRILDAPKWVQSNRYDVEAKVSPEDAPKMDKLKMEQRREMLLPLLEERFNLKYHHETRELPMYALVVAKGGPKLIETNPGDPKTSPDGHTAAAGPGGPMPPPGGPGPIANPDGPPRVGNKGIIGEGMRMRPGSIESHGGTTDFLGHALSGMLGRTVVNKTGLTGNYDFSLNWIPDESMRNVFGGPGGGEPKGDPPPDEAGPTLFTALEEQLGLKLESQKGMVDVIVIDHIDPPSEN